MALDERLRTLGDDLGAAGGGLDVDAALAATRRRRARRRRRSRAAVVGSTAALVVAAALVTGLVIGSDDSSEEVATEGPSTTVDPPTTGGPVVTAPTAPPEAPRPGELFVWVSEPEIPVGTEELAVALANPPDGGESPTFGVGADLERWDGERWIEVHAVALSLDFWLSRGSLVPPGEPMTIPLIGLGAGPGSVGSLLWLPTAELEAGSYRLVIEGSTGTGGDRQEATAAGRFDVVAEASLAAPPPRPLDPPQLRVRPSVVPVAGGQVHVQLGGVGSIQELEAFWAGMDDPNPDRYPELARWDGARWVPFAELAGMPPVSGDTSVRALGLPGGPPGAYRLTIPTPDGQLAEARFWVEDVFAPSTSPAVLAEGTVEELDPGPLTARGGVEMAVIDGTVVVWGGGPAGQGGQYHDGAAYDLATGSWTMLPDAPLEPAARRVGVVSGDELVIFSGTTAAAFSPSTGAWRPLPDPQVEVADAFAIDDGALVVLGEGDEGGALLRAGAEEWSPVPAPPLWAERSGAWTGEELVVTDGVRGARWRPGDDEWAPTAAPPDLGPRVYLHDAAWTGSALVVVTDQMTVASYDPSADEWTRLPDLPVRYFEGGPRVFTVDGNVVVSRAPALAVLSGDGSWVPLPEPMAMVFAVADGDSLLAFGSDGYTGNRFVRFRPTAAAERPPMLQLGMGRLRLAATDRLVRTSAPPSPRWTGAVAATITTAAGECVVTSEFNVGSTDVQLTEGSDGEWQGVVAGDAVTIECTEADDGRRLAAALLPSA